MAHTLICGLTMSGKTTLARLLAVEAMGKGVPVIVFDPMHDAWPEGCVVDRDLDTFMARVWQSRGCLLIADESGIAIGKWKPETDFLTTTSRHLGHSAVILCQRLAQLSPTLRSNCVRVYMFASTRDDREALAHEFDVDLELPALQQGEFILFRRFKPTLAGRVDLAKGAIFTSEVSQ